MSTQAPTCLIASLILSRTLQQKFCIELALKFIDSVTKRMTVLDEYQLSADTWSQPQTFGLDIFHTLYVAISFRIMTVAI